MHIAKTKVSSSARPRPFGKKTKPHSSLCFTKTSRQDCRIGSHYIAPSVLLAKTMWLGLVKEQRRLYLQIVYILFFEKKIIFSVHYS